MIGQEVSEILRWSVILAFSIPVSVWTFKVWTRSCVSYEDEYLEEQRENWEYARQRRRSPL